MKTKYNPERRTWRGKSHKQGGKRVRKLRDHSHLYEANCPACHPELERGGR